MLKLLLTICFLTVAFNASANPLVGESAASMWDGEVNVVDGQLNLKTTGKGQPSLIRWELNAPTDMNRKVIEVWMRLTSIQNWLAIEVRMSEKEDFSTFAAIPLLRYHDRDFNWLQEGSLERLTFPMGEANVPPEVDMTKIKYIAIYVQDASQGVLEVQFSQPRILEAKSKAVVSITFDDGDASQFEAAQMAYRYGLRGTAYIMPREIDLPQFLSKAQVLSMQNKLGWEISAHHAIPLTDMQPTQMQDEMKFAIDFLNGIGAYDGAAHFAYPLGKTNAHTVLPFVRQTFSSARRAGGGAESLPPANWHMLRSIYVTPAISPEWLQARIQTAQAQGEWLILMFHKIVPGQPTLDVEYNVAEYEKLLKVIRDSKVDVLTISEVQESQRAENVL